MATKTVSRNKEFVSVPRELYEEFLTWQKINSTKTFVPTAADKRALARGRRNFAKGNYVTLKQLKHELGIDN